MTIVVGTDHGMSNHGPLDNYPEVHGLIQFDAVGGCRISLVNGLQSSDVFDDR